MDGLCICETIKWVCRCCGRQYTLERDEYGHGESLPPKELRRPGKPMIVQMDSKHLKKQTNWEQEAGKI